MPQISSSDCVPILQHKIARLSAFMEEKKNSIGDEAVSDVAWARFADVIEQMRNVHGLPTGITMSKIAESINLTSAKV